MGDWSSPLYIASQVVVVFAYVFFAWSYLCKKRTAILGLSIAHNILLAVSFGMLWAWAGVSVLALEVVRDFVSYFRDKNRTELEKKKIYAFDWFLLVFWLSTLTVATIFTESGFLKWFALFSSALFTVSIWQKKVFTYRLLAIPASILWAIYSFGEQNFFGFILECSVFIVTIIGIVLYTRSNKTNHKP